MHVYMDTFLCSYLAEIFFSSIYNVPDTNDKIVNGTFFNDE